MDLISLLSHLKNGQQALVRVIKRVEVYVGKEMH